MATSPVIYNTPAFGSAVISSANTNRDGSTGTYTTVLAGAAAPGRKLLRAVIKAIVTTTAGMVRLWHYDGSNRRLIMEITVDAITVGANTIGFEASIDLNDLDWYLPGATSEIQATTHNSEAFHVSVWGADSL